MPSLRSRAAGFTMVELLAVLIVLGLSATVVSVNWRRIVPQAELGAEVRALSEALRSARSDAIGRNAEFRILYELDEDRYWVSSPFRTDGGRASTDEERSKLFERTLPEGVDLVELFTDDKPLTSGEGWVFFTPEGGASSHSVVLYHAQTDRFHTIEVIGLTALIRFHDGRFVRRMPEEGELD